MTVRDFIEATLKDSPRKASLLLNVEAIIHQLGYDWNTLPPDQWVEVYKHLTNLSPQLIKHYDWVIRSYYEWLDEQEILPKRLSPYRALGLNQISEVYAYLNRRKYISTIDDLFNLVDNLQVTRRITEKGKLVNKGLLALIWTGLQYSDILLLQESDVIFFDENDSFLEAPSAAQSIAKLVITVHHPIEGETSFTISNKKSIHIIHTLWAEAHAFRVANHLENCPLLIAEGAGKHTGDIMTLTLSSLNMRVNRIVSSINETYDLDLTVRSIRASAMYHAAYTYWKVYKLPWYFTSKNVETLFRFLKRDVACGVSIQKVEFQRFIEYASSVKNDPLN